MKLRCPRCQQKLTIADKFAGRGVRCPACNKPFTVPTPKSSTEALADKMDLDLEGLAGMMKSSITELQGMMGGEMGQSMQQLRQAAAGGEGQMRATLDLAKEMGSNVSRQQEMRKARGSMLFQEYKKKMGMVQPEAAASGQPAATPAEKQKIAE